jgi:antitoxin component YwqK of YwqJK toxin-antitoxin module
MAGGKKVGRWDYYDPARYFPAVQEKDTAGKRRELSSTCYYTAGELDSAWSYQGTWTYFNRYKNGQEFGWQESYRNGKKDYFAYIDGNGHRTHYYQWVESGIMFSEMHDDSNGYVHNLYYEDDGKLQSSTKMRSDSVYEETAYRHDGSIIVIGTLKEEYVSYYTRTFFYIEDYWNIRGEHVVINGTGHLVEWYNDSVKALEVDVKNGILYGTYREWDSNGQLSEEAFYYPPGDRDTYGNAIEPFTSNYYSRYGVPYGTRRVWSGDKLYFEDIHKPDGSVHRISYDKNGEIDYESDDQVNWMRK